MELNAIRNLYNKDCTKDGDVVLIEGVAPTPTEWAEIKIEVARIQAEYDAKQYARSRVLEYPAIGDQLDALYHAGVFPEDMAAQIQAVKERYPKT